MATLKGLYLFGISVAVSACFDPPEFSHTPEIDFESIYYKEAETAGERDELVLTISFRDGDGDLGLSSTDIDPPYHDVNYYLASDGEIIPLEKRMVYDNLPQFVDVPPNVVGKLVTVKTSKDPLYKNSIPLYVDDQTSCTYYTYTSVYVNEADRNIFDERSLDTVLSFTGLPKVYVLLDTFYYQKNPNYANIEVEFLIKEGNDFKLFDWEKEFCTISFDQRFHVLSDDERPLKGSLEYTMATSGLKVVFANETLKLRVRIRDRALNISEPIETAEFTLDQITKD